jgi:helicase
MMAIEEALVGEMEPVEDLLLERSLIFRKEGKMFLSPLARVMAEHFIGVERLSRISDLVRDMKDPLDIIAELDCATDEEAALERGRRRRPVTVRTEEKGTPPGKKTRKGRGKKRR